MLKDISTVGIVVPRLDIARSYFEQIYGVITSEPVESKPGILSSIAPFRNTKVELMEPIDKDGHTSQAEYLRYHPKGGIHHIAFSTDNIDNTLESFSAIGVNPLEKPRQHPSLHKKTVMLDPYYTQEIMTELVEE
ncbi:hypothetical protein TVAG_083440 [Trichomonas vaginalis G3]|uniref:VOC domain-containing protein n=1 Tax=Trichomonas vaginalis (strain ATCC PRA-98 / G3) TaxID=412133 RepID=A2DM71_TRIV3|nr:methylmalonyl-CoA epimerase domain-containing protein [Trichomonas vaginalis G3]EAY18491.1 hypothetical protein TVAG_083440 [Trichomonas vaginalis G3]KAI5489520.1 methylmalonyl-CoA epimerase domain-containing protein [Trichomonas vaginalis G3]|eukprot:XP_001579477.1 hypothetical protein [Trichomonas vaginalis G3]